jgi:hypothetical protein
MKAGSHRLTFVALGAIALASWLWFRPSSPPPRSTAELEAQVEALRAMVQAQTRASQRGEHSSAGEVTAASAPRTPLEPEMAPRKAPAEDPEASPTALTFEESKAAVLEAYAAETNDPGWSAQAARQLDTIVRAHLPSGSQVTALECRATMCEIKLVHRDPKAGTSFLMDGFRDWAGPIFVAGEQQDRDRTVVTLIASQEGTTPPLGPR